MALLDGEVYEAYRSELLKRYKTLLKTLGKDLPKEKISLIRAAAKNYNDVVIIPSVDQYAAFLSILNESGNQTTLSQRKAFARDAFMISSHYDTHIFNYFN